jgi:hypothetical protein
MRLGPVAIVRLKSTFRHSSSRVQYKRPGEAQANREKWERWVSDEPIPCSTPLAGRARPLRHAMERRVKLAQRCVNDPRPEAFPPSPATGKAPPEPQEPRLRPYRCSPSPNWMCN